MHFSKGILDICIYVLGLHRTPWAFISWCILCFIQSWRNCLQEIFISWTPPPQAPVLRCLLTLFPCQSLKCSALVQQRVFEEQWKGLSPTFETILLKWSCCWAYWNHWVTFLLANDVRDATSHYFWNDPHPKNTTKHLYIIFHANTLFWHIPVMADKSFGRGPTRL